MTEPMTVHVVTRRRLGEIGEGLIGVRFTVADARRLAERTSREAGAEVPLAWHLDDRQSGYFHSAEAGDDTYYVLPCQAQDEPDRDPDDPRCPVCGEPGLPGDLCGRCAELLGADTAARQVLLDEALTRLPADLLDGQNAGRVAVRRLVDLLAGGGLSVDPPALLGQLGPAAGWPEADLLRAVLADLAAGGAVSTATLAALHARGATERA